MINSPLEVVLRRRWLVVTLISLVIISVEVVEHRPGLKDMTVSFAGEVLVFGILFPVCVGILLGRMDNAASRSAVPTVALDRTLTRENAVKRVLIVENDLLLGAGIERLLSQNANIELLGLASARDIDFAKHINQFKPDVIVMDEASYLASSIRPLTLLKNCPSLRVVMVNTNDTLVHIYDKQQIRVTQMTELVNVVRRREGSPQMTTNNSLRSKQVLVK